MYCVSRTWSKEEPHYEFDLELREKIAAARRKAAEAERGGGEGEGEGEGRLWTSASSEPRLDSRVNGITGTSTGGHISENGRQALVMYTTACLLLMVCCIPGSCRSKIGLSGRERGPRNVSSGSIVMHTVHLSCSHWL